ncbi:MAG: methyl-accepting chemotaxis protein [Treponema sp.]|nr:methyl-accepting chemotaxis protein [Treponema sp.]
MLNKIKGLKIRSKLLFAFLFVAVIMLCTSLISIIDMNSTVSISEENVYKVLDPLERVLQARVSMGNIKLKGRDIVYDRNAQRRNTIIDGFFVDIGNIKDDMQVFSDTIELHQARVLYNEFEGLLDSWEYHMHNYQDKLNIGENPGEFILEVLSPISDRCLDILTELSILRIGLGKDIALRNKHKSEFGVIRLMIISLIALTIIVFFGIYFSVSASKPIMLGTDLVKIVAGGDFTVKFPDEYYDEFGEFYNACNSLMEFNRMTINGIRENAQQMRESAMSLLTVSSQMETNSKELSEKTEAVSTVTEEFSAGMTQSTNSLSTASTHISAMATSIEEINSTISNVAAAAEETSMRVDQSSALVDNIQKSIVNASGSVKLVSSVFNNVAKSVEEINKSIIMISVNSVNAKNKMLDADEKAKNTNDIIRRLEAASKQIGKIVNVISDIADQTNMLALNAAIEAAGAGEAGKSFMIVANEVKELAKQTADATEEIAEHIENMQKNMPEAVGAVSEITSIISDMTEYVNSFAKETTQSRERSDQIASESATAAQRMSEINSEIISISENAQSVTKTVVESTKGVNEIAKSTAELVVGTQEIAMNSERASNNISEINRAAREMALGLVDISRNLQLLNGEAGEVNHSASSTKEASETILKIAGEMENSVKNFKIN